jgi:hypothetical protein
MEGMRRGGGWKGWERGRGRGRRMGEKVVVVATMVWMVWRRAPLGATFQFKERSPLPMVSVEWQPMAEWFGRGACLTMM